MNVCTSQPSPAGPRAAASLSLRDHLLESAGIPFLYVRAAYRILRSRRLLGLCIVPWLIGAASFIFFVLAFLTYKDRLAFLVTGQSDTWLAMSVGWALLVINIIVSALLAIVSMSILGSFFLEKLMTILLEEKNLKIPQYLTLKGVLLAFIRSLKDELKRALILAFVGMILIFFGFMPLFYPVVLLGGAFLLGYNILDPPLALLEIPWRLRWQLARRHWAAVIVLGAVFSPFLFIPLGGIMVLPAASQVAIEKLAQWVKV